MSASQSKFTRLTKLQEKTTQNEKNQWALPRIDTFDRISKHKY